MLTTVTGTCKKYFGIFDSGIFLSYHGKPSRNLPVDKCCPLAGAHEEHRTFAGNFHHPDSINMDVLAVK